MATKFTYYSFDKILSYNALFNFVCGARGLGKTYGMKYKVIKKALKGKSQFIYLRRYKGDLAGKDTFFADIEDRFPDWDLRVEGYKAQAAHISTRDADKRSWKTIGFFIALSVAASKKSISYHNVTDIIYDEFIIEKGFTRYIPDEAKAFMEFYVTVDRMQERCRVMFLANSVSIDNPFFLFYSIVPTVKDQLIVKNEGVVCAHFPDSEEYKREVYATRLGRMLQGTEYAEYAFESVFKDNNDHLIETKTSESDYLFSIETKKGTFSVWIDWDTDIYYFLSRRPKSESLYTLIPERMTNEKTLLIRSDKLASMVRTAFRHGNAKFDKPQTKASLLEIFK